MNEIPEDVLKSAADACKAHNVPAMGVPFHPSAAALVAITAILAERERCAAIAKAAADTFERCGPLSLGSTAGDVWFRIRQGQAKEGESD